jgi:HD-GYP domain-containing protein (c-di-GMP phosphodiesterase class II)
MLVWTQPIYGIQEQSKMPTALFNFSSLERRAWVVLGLFPFVVVASFIFYSLHLYEEKFNLLSFIFFVGMLFISKHSIIRIDDFSFDLEPVVVLASLLVLGPFYTLVISLVGSCWFSLFISRKNLKIWAHIFNFEVVFLTVSSSSLCYYFFPKDSFIAFLLAGVLISILNYILLALYYAVLDQKSIINTWRENRFSFTASLFIIYIPLGYLLGRLFWVSPFLVFLFVSPFIMLYAVSRSFFDIRQKMGSAIQTFSDLLAQRDEYTYEHTLRVANYARAIAEEMGLKQETVDECVRTARLHDIGKIAVPDHVLLKEGALTDEEFHHIQEHVSLIPKLFPHMNRFGKILRLVMYHHEKYDGTGYPIGLKGEEIPIEARVVSVADAWDAMTTSRVYRKKLPLTLALEVLQENVGKQWDPKVVEAFLRAYEKGLCQPPLDEAA